MDDAVSKAKALMENEKLRRDAILAKMKEAKILGEKTEFHGLNEHQKMEVHAKFSKYIIDHPEEARNLKLGSTSPPFFHIME